jgi:hypothetical protein
MSVDIVFSSAIKNRDYYHQQLRGRWSRSLILGSDKKTRVNKWQLRSKVPVFTVYCKVVVNIHKRIKQNHS